MEFHLKLCHMEDTQHQAGPRHREFFGRRENPVGLQGPGFDFQEWNRLPQVWAMTGGLIKPRCLVGSGVGGLFSLTAVVGHSGIHVASKVRAAESPV